MNTEPHPDPAAGRPPATTETAEIDPAEIDPAEIDPAEIDPATLVRRALLASATELSAALDAVRPGDRRRLKALDRWFGGFAAQVRSHHELLDGVVVPTLAARGALDDRALDALADDHAAIDELLSDLGDALGVLSFGLGAEDFWVAKAADLAAVLRYVLGHQLRREDALLTPLVARVLDGDERAAVHDDTVRAVADGPVRFSLAWLFAHVTETERAVLDRHATVAGRLLGRTGRGAYQRTTVAALGC